MKREISWVSGTRQSEILDVANVAMADLEYEQLDSMLEQQTCAEEPARLCAYLRRTLPRSLAKLKTDARDTDWQAQQATKKRCKDFTRRVLRIVREARNMPKSDYHVFHLYVFLRAYIFDDAREAALRLDSYEDRKIMDEADKAHEEAQEETNKLLQADIPHLLQMIRRSARSAAEESPPARLTPRGTFWNFAACKRELDNSRARWRFRGFHLFVTRAASIEVEANVMLAVGHKLPGELVNLVLHYAWIEEGLQCKIKSCCPRLPQPTIVRPWDPFRLYGSSSESDDESDQESSDDD